MVLPAPLGAAGGRAAGGRAAGRRAGRRRVETRLSPLVPGPVGLLHLPGGHALPLGLHHLLDHRARVPVEGGVQQPLGVAGRGARGVNRLLHDARERRVHSRRLHHPVDQAHRERRLRRHVIVEQGQLLGPAEPDDPGQAEDRAVRDEAVPRRAQAEDRVGGGQTQVAGDPELEAAADGVAVQHRDHDLVHVLEAVQRADPVPVERLVDPARRQHRAVHARAERPARAPHHHRPHVRVAGGRLRRVGQLRGQRAVQRVEHARPIQGDGGDALPRRVEYARLGPPQLRAPRMSRAMTIRWISEVPSPISVSLASRKIRSMGNSLM